jgi:hypothetical protein
MIKIKVHTNWCDDLTLREHFNRCTPEHNYIWKNIILTNNNDYDFFVIFNYPKHENFNHKKSIIFQSETPTTRNRWGKYANPCKSDFFYVYDTKTYNNLDKWFINLNYRQLLNSDLFVKEKLLSGIVSSNNSLTGHIKRLHFVTEYLNTLDYYDHYGMGNFNNLQSYKGAVINKEDGLLKYKYTFNCENDYENNYFTEKIIDGILCECVTFYDGCPNLENFINKECFIRIDLNDMDTALDIIKSSIENNEWDKRIDSIKTQKNILMNDLNPLNIIYKIVNNVI